MASIIQLLFSSGITFSSSREEDSKLGSLSESVQQSARQLCAAQPELWEKYQAQAEELHNLERQIEFERGFLMAAHLTLEVMTQKPEH